MKEFGKQRDEHVGRAHRRSKVLMLEKRSRCLVWEVEKERTKKFRRESWQHTCWVGTDGGGGWDGGRFFR